MQNYAESDTDVHQLADTELGEWLHCWPCDIDASTRKAPVIYLSGPMSGIEGHNFDNFHKAERSIAAIPLLNPPSILNPAKNFDGRTDLARDEYMRKDIELLLQADAVVVLDGWQDSVGATTEVRIAGELNLPVFHIRTGRRVFFARGLTSREANQVMYPDDDCSSWRFDGTDLVPPPHRFGE